MGYEARSKVIISTEARQYHLKAKDNSWALLNAVLREIISRNRLARISMDQRRTLREYPRRAYKQMVRLICILNHY